MSLMAPVFEIRQQGGADAKWRKLLTHIEIRRAQNGFIVMGFNVAPKPGDMPGGGDMRLRRVCFVCESVQSLCATIESLTTDAGDYAWEASVDMPITDLYMERKIRDDEKG
ncbi:MAG: hypothetical protein QG672_1646 [Pseudomonadota bacterium]|jgi:hypothetical protein|nr:hypothetical protein [Pseudomonadota bacterium]